MSATVRLEARNFDNGCESRRSKSWSPESVTRELAGHVDPQMMRIYSHPRVAARPAAVEALGTVKAGQLEGGYVTNHVTKLLPAES